MLSVATNGIGVAVKVGATEGVGGGEGLGVINRPVAETATAGAAIRVAEGSVAEAVCVTGRVSAEAVTNRTVSAGQPTRKRASRLMNSSVARRGTIVGLTLKVDHGLRELPVRHDDPLTISYVDLRIECANPLNRPLNTVHNNPVTELKSVTGIVAG